MHQPAKKHPDGINFAMTFHNGSNSQRADSIELEFELLLTTKILRVRLQLVEAQQLSGGI